MSKPEKIFALDEMDEGYRRFIEREDVIRCRDCKHFDQNVDEYIGEDGSNPKCNRLTYVFEKYHGGVKWLHRPTVSPDGFCAWAVRLDGKYA